MRIKELSPSEWMELSYNAHLICFDELRSPLMDRIDFALLSLDDDVPLGFMTCREQDAESVYMQFGGKFPSSDSVKAFKGYVLALQHLERNYRRASTLIENTNTTMLKFAMKVGLRITGIKYFNNKVLLEHTIEWSKS